MCHAGNGRYNFFPEDFPEKLSSLVFVTQQFQLFFTFVLGDFFPPFLFQVAHFSILISFDYTTMRFS